MTIDYQNKTKNPRRRMPVGAVLFIMAVVVVGAFIFYFFREKAMADIAGNYSKTSGDLLTASDWNNLDNDFLHVGNITQQKQGALILNTGGSTNGLIVQSGNVGIGTTAPGAKLHVVGGSAIIDPSGASANAFKVLASNGNTAFSISNTGTAESFVFGSDGLAQASFGIITSGNTIKFQTHTVDRMAIDTSGNVGIGTTTPLYPLTISNIFPNGAAGIGIDVSNTVSQNFIRMTTNGDLTTRWEFGKSGTSNPDPGNFYLFHGIANRVLTATPSGNVGIGTTDPGTYKLKVAGTFYAATSTLVGALDMGSNKITSVADPISNQDAATKAYVLANAGTSIDEQIYSTTANSGMYNNKIPAMTPPAAYTEVCFKNGATSYDIHTISESTTGGNCVPGDVGFIIEKNERAANFWELAKQTCLQNNMRLAEPFEWKLSCKNAATWGLFDMTNNWEWASNFSLPVYNGGSGVGAAIFGGGGCHFATWHWVGSSAGSEGSSAFRCVR